jgi:hypothetical protein
LPNLNGDTLVHRASIAVGRMTKEERAELEREISKLPAIPIAKSWRAHQGGSHTASQYCSYCVAEQVEAFVRDMEMRIEQTDQHKANSAKAQPNRKRRISPALSPLTSPETAYHNERGGKINAITGRRGHIPRRDEVKAEQPESIIGLATRTCQCRKEGGYLILSTHCKEHFLIDRSGWDRAKEPMPNRGKRRGNVGNG